MVALACAVVEPPPEEGRQSLAAAEGRRCRRVAGGLVLTGAWPRAARLLRPKPSPAAAPAGLRRRADAAAREAAGAVPEGGLELGRPRRARHKPHPQLDYSLVRASPPATFLFCYHLTYIMNAPLASACIRSPSSPLCLHLLWSKIGLEFEIIFFMGFRMFKQNSEMRWWIPNTLLLSSFVFC